jgi:heme exporter protein D
MDSVQTFLQMGGYAAYVWPAYGIAAAVLAGLAIASYRGMRRAERQAERERPVRPRRGGEGQDRGMP